MITLSLRQATSVVCLGAHPDDIEIGCGGLLIALSARGGATVNALVMSGDPIRTAETRAALPQFFPGAQVEVAGFPDGRLPGHWETVKDVLHEFGSHRRPDVVLAPRADDAHQDHRLIGELARTVWRDSLILHYEIPKWDGDLGAPTVFLPLDRQTAHRKVELLNTCFPTQHSRDWWDDELFLGLMRIRGVESRAAYAEAYFVSKAVITFDEATQE